MGWSVPGINNSTDGYGCLVQVNPIDVKESWQDCIVTLKQYEAALAASKPEWDGDGLPPVGCECEGKQLAQINWNKFKVVAIENGHIFGFWNDNVSTGLDSRLWEFRPLRSETDKKRDEIIEALKEGLGHAHGLFDIMQIYHLLNNGKIPHIRID